jgi:hypothetical protein
MIPPQPAVELAAQHLVLMAQYQQLGVPGQVRLIPQQNPSSRYEVEFPSGTRSASAHKPKIVPLAGGAGRSANGQRAIGQVARVSTPTGAETLTDDHIEVLR